MKAKGSAVVATVVSSDLKRDAYGFVVRPQHVQRYRQYANIYKEEEEERLDRWKDFLARHSESAQLPVNDSFKTNKKPESLNEEYKDVQTYAAGVKVDRVQKWKEVRSSLRAIEDMMSWRVKKKAGGLIKRHDPDIEEDSEEEFYDLERSESVPVQEITSGDSHLESQPLWKEELECLVQGGVPMELRGEMWQAFAGVRARRVEKYYQNLLAPDFNVETKKKELEEKNHGTNQECVGLPEKWKVQIEKDLPRTFPGHPALDEDGRNA